MILDSISNMEKYVCFIPGLKHVHESILKNADRETGRQDLGEGHYVIVSCYETGKPQERLEIHLKHIDVHVVLSGEERIAFSPVQGLNLCVEYNLEQDAAFYHMPEEYTLLLLKPGQFAVFLPEDAHMAGHCVSEPIDVRKVVFKLNRSDL